MPYALCPLLRKVFTMTKIVHCFLYVFLVIVISGCTGDKVPLKGKVTFKEDGSPLSRGTVCFEKDGFSARGTLSADGTYQVSSVKQNDGIPPGLYKVYIFGAEGPVTDTQAGGMMAPRVMQLVATKYTNAETSEIKVQVDGKTREFNFEVEKP